MESYEANMGSEEEESSCVEDPMKSLYADILQDEILSDFDSDDMLEAHEI